MSTTYFPLLIIGKRFENSFELVSFIKNECDMNHADLQERLDRDLDEVFNMDIDGILVRCSIKDDYWYVGANIAGCDAGNSADELIAGIEKGKESWAKLFPNVYCKFYHVVDCY